MAVNILLGVDLDGKKDILGFWTCENEEQALVALEELAQKWDGKYPYISKSWRNNWDELSTFFKYPNEIRRLIYTTNAIESFNSLLRKYTKNRGAFMNEMSLYKLIYLASDKLMKKWSMAIKNWGLIFSQLNIMFPERLAGYVK